MRLSKARIRKYRSIRDTGLFDVEFNKTILVGPNEAGKTAILQALQQLNAPPGVKGFDPLRDYPRSEYNDISKGIVKPENVVVAEGHFIIEDADAKDVAFPIAGSTFVVSRKLNNTTSYSITGAPPWPSLGELEKDLRRLAAHVDAMIERDPEGKPLADLPSQKLELIFNTHPSTAFIFQPLAAKINAWLKEAFPLIDEDNAKEEERYDRLVKLVDIDRQRASAIDTLKARVPVFVLYSNYFRVRPLLHLQHLAERLETGILDDDTYDYGNKCLLDLLGFTARSLSDLGKAPEPQKGDPDALKAYRDQLDRRSYQLNAASVKLTEEITQIWAPNQSKGEADKLRISADSQYLKVVVEDSLGVEIELDQRSEGFQWLVSFFVVFFAESEGANANAILLLDEPGLNLHALKQREFRGTISRLAETNQTIYTTHSPFLVGPEELDLVRVVEMVDRTKGTNVHGNLTAADSGALLPLQEALGYDLAQSLFTNSRNLVCEGLTDYWYLEGMANLLSESGDVVLNQKISLIPASSAGKVVYFSTILHAQNLKVAALLDSDTAGDHAAAQDVLVGTLGNKRILRTKDAYRGDVDRPEIEDLLRSTLIKVGKEDLGWDVEATASAQPKRGIVSIFESEIKDFSKYRLAKGFLRWSRENPATELSDLEREQWKTLIQLINRVLP